MQKKLRITARIFLGFFAVLTALVLLTALVFAVAESVADNSAYFAPSRPKEDISELIYKEEWTEEDLDVLYHQTGLMRPALEALKYRPSLILDFQDALYKDYVLGHEEAAFTTQHDILKGYRTEKNGKEEIVFRYVPIAPLEDGDVIISSSCHTFGWRNGHAAIVVNAANYTTLECVGPGTKSALGDVSWFQYASNFMVLRLKGESAEKRKEIAQYANLHLRDIEYSILTGFFSSPKDQGIAPKTSHCSHLVWQAYKYFGYDIDPDGGPVCTTRDIANCDLFEVVQVFGFDQDKLWK